MTDYKVGYKKPPLEHRFKKGVSGNPLGRAVGKTSTIEEVIDDALLEEKVFYREGGRRRSASRFALIVRAHIEKALLGDVPSARMILQLHRSATKQPGGKGVSVTRVMNAWPKD